MPEELEREANTAVNSVGTTVNFFTYGEIYQSDAERSNSGERPQDRPRLIVPMSFQLVIPRRVALQQSSPPLHQPRVILKEKRKFEKGKSLNCMCANSKLSQQRGSPHSTVSKLCQILSLDHPCARIQLHFIGLAVHLFQRFALHLQLHLRILFEDFGVTLSEELSNPLVGDTARTESSSIG